MDPFQVEETSSTPAVKSLRSKFEQLATSNVSPAGGASSANANASSTLNGKSSSSSSSSRLPVVPQRPERPVAGVEVGAVPLTPQISSSGGLSKGGEGSAKGGDGKSAGVPAEAGGGGGEFLSPAQLARPRASSGTPISTSNHAPGNVNVKSASLVSLNTLARSPSPSLLVELKRPPPPAPTGIKRPPPRPPTQSIGSPSLTQRSRTPTLMPNSASAGATFGFSTSPSWGAGRAQLGSSPVASPVASPLLRPVPVPPPRPNSASSSSTTGTPPGEGFSRPPSRDEPDGNEETPQNVASLRNRFGDTSSHKMHTPRQSLSTTYPSSSDTPSKPAIPPRPGKNFEAPAISPRLSTSPEEMSIIPAFNITPPRAAISSPFSDDEADLTQPDLVTPLVPVPARKPPPPKPPAGGTNAPSVRSLGTHSSNSSQGSFETASNTSSSSHTNISTRPPPPPPPPRIKPKSSTAPPDSYIPTTSSTPKLPNPPPPLPSRRPNTMPPSDVEPAPTPSTPALPPPRPSNRSSQLSPQPPSPSPAIMKLDPVSPQSPIIERKSLGSAKLPPPPTRMIALGDKLPPARRLSGDSSDEDSGDEGTAVEDTKGPGGDSFPDSSRSSRRPPIAAPFRIAQFDMPKVPIQAYGGHYVVAGSLVAVGHHYSIKIYDLSVVDSPIYMVDTKEMGGKITCMEMKCVGDGELRRGLLMWVGTKEGNVLEVNLRNGVICATKQVARLHPVTHVLRYGQAMVTLDEGGKALVFGESEGGAGVSLTKSQPRVVRITEKQDFVRMLGGKLWTAARAESQNGAGGNVTSRLPIIRVYDLFSPGSTGKSVLPTEHVGAVTSATMIPSQLGKVYVGHEEGFVSIWAVEGTEDGYPKCLEVVKVSTSDVLCLEGVNDRLWIGSRNGMISAYEVAARPWVVTNSWIAHPGLPVLKLSVDALGIDEGRLNVVSVGRDETMKFWDGLLGMDWIETELQKREATYSTFRDVTALIISWNCDAARPDSLTGDPANVNLLNDILSSVDEAPDVIAFGFQEVVDLENRKMTAKNVLLGGAAKKKHNEEGVTGLACSGNGLSDKVTGAYRRWFERLVREVRAAMPQVPYAVVHTESLVGLFSCTFIKASERFVLRDVAVSTVKRGMKGRYGNKGGIMARFVMGDSSICMINCHLAAGQNAVRSRNKDFAAILETKTVFPPTEYPMAYVGGGDGTMILDHEIVLVNGDLNYRIDHRREAIISSIRAGEFGNLLVHDQLLREIKLNRGCRFRGFSEGAITFAPTYKYDPRSNEYDSSEKRRLPAWCDRVLWRSRDPSRVQQLHYQRYEANVSDHRPISSAFRVTIKTIQHELRTQAMRQVQLLWAEEQARMLAEARRVYREHLH